MSQKQKYLIHNAGEMNLILSAPHSGVLTPRSIPRRKKGSLLKDGYTDRIIKGVLEYFDYKPYYIYAEIHRSRVDLNRDLVEAAEGSKRAKAIWYEWDTVMKYFLANAAEKYEKTLYVDIHSHNNGEEFHLGYGVSAREYLDLYDGTKVSAATSLDAFPYRLDHMLFGRKSFKHHLESCGYKVYTPKEDTVYFSGGRNVRTYNNKSVGAVQLEIPTPLADKDLHGIISCVGDCIKGFMEKYVDTDPRASSGG